MGTMCFGTWCLPKVSKFVLPKRPMVMVSLNPASLQFAHSAQSLTTRKSLMIGALLEVATAIGEPCREARFSSWPSSAHPVGMTEYWDSLLIDSSRESTAQQFTFAVMQPETELEPLFTLPLKVRLASLAAVAFYQANGFQELGTGEHALQSGKRMACVSMRKHL